MFPITLYSVNGTMHWSIDYDTDQHYWATRDAKVIRRRDNVPFLDAIQLSVKNGDSIQPCKGGEDHVFAGRKLLLPEALHIARHNGIDETGFAPLVQRLRLAGLLDVVPAVTMNRRKPTCLRCGSHAKMIVACASCNRARCVSCAQCIQMGRSRQCEWLLIGKPLDQIEQTLARWSLSPAQRQATKQALTYLHRPYNPLKPNERDSRTMFLLWAVTGAGKTEMIFPLIDDTLRQGKRVLLATPRRDVIVELQPRIAKAFPHIDQVVLYGGSEDRWKSAQLVLATTHQVIRWHRAFALVILDEVDAFPYHNNPMLQHAAEQATTEEGVTVMLSATPSSALQRAARRNTLAHARIPVRYHRHPLPVPLWLRIPPMTEWKRTIPEVLIKAIKRSIERQAQLFIFIDRIASVEPVVAMLSKQVPVRVGGTSSKDVERAMKIEQFRRSEIRVLVTTTILERGVTIPRSDVIVLEADAKLFDAAALIQMAGRAGRAADDPIGFVTFASAKRSPEQQDAIKQIIEMNAYARKEGYLVEPTMD